jgi:hypothetical protein
MPGHQGYRAFIAIHYEMGTKQLRQTAGEAQQNDTYIWKAIAKPVHNRKFELQYMDNRGNPRQQGNTAEKMCRQMPL